jgi:hypothetical protein
MEMLFEGLSEGERDDNRLSVAPGRPASILDLARPYLKGLERDRLEAVTTALQRLDLIQQQRAVMMMPEIVIGN